MDKILRDMIDTLSVPKPDCSVNRTKLEVACLIGQLIAEDLMNGQNGKDALDWIESAICEEIDSLWR